MNFNELFFNDPEKLKFKQLVELQEYDISITNLFFEIDEKSRNLEYFLKNSKIDFIFCEYPTKQKEMKFYALLKDFFNGKKIKYLLILGEMEKAGVKLEVKVKTAMWKTCIKCDGKFAYYIKESIEKLLDLKL